MITHWKLFLTKHNTRKTQTSMLRRKLNLNPSYWLQISFYMNLIFDFLVIEAKVPSFQPIEPIQKTHFLQLPKTTLYDIIFWILI
jgi:hypothetical protein